MVYIWDTWNELGDRLHSLNLDIKSDSHLKLLVMPCLGFLSLLYTNYPEQKCQIMRQVCMYKGIVYSDLAVFTEKVRYWCK